MWNNYKVSHRVKIQDILYRARLTHKARLMGSWKKRDNQDHILEQLCVLHNFNQTTQSMTCWERAYPHCSLGKCQLVLRTSKQSLLHHPLLSQSPQLCSNITLEGGIRAVRGHCCQWVHYSRSCWTATQNY